MKTYFKSSELPHIFAHQSAPTGRCLSAETFEGPVYYSYSTPIAVLLKNKKGEEAVVLNATSYSVPTRGHQGSVQGAVSHIDTKFHVTGIERGRYARIPRDGEAIVAFFLKEFAASEETKPAKCAHIRAFDFLNKINHLEEAIRASRFFGIPRKRLETKLAKLQPEIAEQTRILSEHDAAKRARRDKAEATNLAGIIARAEAWLSNDADNRIYSATYNLPGDLNESARAKNDRISADAAALWVNGDKTVSLPYNTSTLLRREGEEVVTSRGARFPVEHARKAFGFVKLYREKGEAFHCNGRSIHVGHYSIDKITKEGDVTAGCHEIKWDTIENFANSQGWTTKNENQSSQILEQSLNQKP